MGKDLAYLAVWLIGLFSLIGFVMAAVARVVSRDTWRHDREFVWRGYGDWESREEGKPQPAAETRE